MELQEKFDPFADIIAEYRRLRCYRIIRFRSNGKKRTIKSNVTLGEAQEHCGKESTHGNDWFDGYDYMKGCKPHD